MIKLFILTLAALACVTSAAIACNTAMVQISLDDARDRLNRAAKATDFESAKYEAGKARRALEDAAINVSLCDCFLAYNELDTAASRAKRASYAEEPDEFAAELRRAIRGYNDALVYLADCANNRDD